VIRKSIKFFPRRERQCFVVVGYIAQDDDADKLVLIEPQRLDEP
jgi:hypothetical protein